MVFQNYELFPHMTVMDNILLGPLKVQKRELKEATQQAEQLLERVGVRLSVNWTIHASFPVDKSRE